MATAAGAAVGISTVQAPFSRAALCQVKPFLLQTLTQLLTWLANRESTWNLTLSLVQVITGCFFFTWMNVIIKFLTVTLYFSVKLGSKQRRSSINSNGCRKTQTHVIKGTSFPTKYRLKTVNLKGRLPQQPYTLAKLKAKVTVKINFSLQATGGRR